MPTDNTNHMKYLVQAAKTCKEWPNYKLTVVSSTLGKDWCCGSNFDQTAVKSGRYVSWLLTTIESLWALCVFRIVLHNISINRIDIDCELNIDYEYLLKPTSNDIKNRYLLSSNIAKNQCNLSDIKLHSAKIYERNVILITLEGYWVFGMFALNQLYQKSNLKGEISNWTQNIDIVQH